MRLQPCSDRLDVGVGGAELLAVLGGSEPLVIAGRGFVLLVVQQLAQGRLLLGAALQYQEHALHGECGRRRTEVELGTRQGMRIAFENRKLGFVDRLSDEWTRCYERGLLLGSCRLRERQREDDYSEESESGNLLRNCRTQASHGIDTSTLDVFRDTGGARGRKPKPLSLRRMYAPGTSFFTSSSCGLQLQIVAWECLK